MVDVSRGDCVANGDGEFEFESMAAREHVVVVSGQPDEAPGVVRFVPSDPAVEVEVRTLAGTVVHFHVSPPPPVGDRRVATLRIVGEGGLVLEDSDLTRALRSDQPDAFVATLATGHYTAQVERPGFRPASVEFDAPTATTVEILLEAAAKPR
jgi:hypothetical protein